VQTILYLLKRCSLRRDYRKLGVANCKITFSAEVRNECKHFGKSITCRSNQRYKKEGWCRWGGRRHKCYETRCVTCNDGYYRANNGQCNECSQLGNCNSVTCSSAGNSDCKFCIPGFYKDGQCNICPSIKNCANVECDSSDDSVCKLCKSGYFLKDSNACIKDKCTIEERENVPEEEFQGESIERDLKFNSSAVSSFLCGMFGSALPAVFSSDGEIGIGGSYTYVPEMSLKNECIYTVTNTSDYGLGFDICGKTISGNVESTNITKKQCQSCEKSFGDNCPYLVPFKEKQPLHYFNNELGGCTTQTKSRSYIFAASSNFTIGGPGFLSNFLGFDLEWSYGFKITVTDEQETPLLQHLPCDDRPCSTYESETLDVAIKGTVAFDTEARLGGTLFGWKLGLEIGASGSARAEIGASIKFGTGGTKGCGEGAVGLAIQGFVKILWFTISVTVVDLGLTVGIGESCSPHDIKKHFWSQMDGTLFPNFRWRRNRKERNLQYVSRNTRILTKHGWKPVLGKGSYKFDVMSINRFNSIWESSNKILRRKCDNCIDSHQDIYYRRMDQSENLREFDLIEVIKEYFNTGEALSKNKFGIDFNLYSTYQDALDDTNSWEYCDVAVSDDEIVGFPSKCSPSEDIVADEQWSVITDAANLAYGRPVYSSKQINEFSLKYIRDGIKVLEDESESYALEPETYITINLEENTNISYILLYCTDVNYNFEIEVLDAEKNPTYKITYSREEVYSWPERIELPGEGQLVRIYNNHENVITLVEVEVFGVMSKYSRSDIGGQQNVAFYVETGATGCILYDIDAMTDKVQNNETLTDNDLQGCDDLVEDDLTWNDVELSCEDTNHQCGFITTVSGTKDCGSCSEGSFCGPSLDSSGTRCQCTPGVQICQRSKDDKGQIGFCKTDSEGNGNFEMIEECVGSCTYDGLGQPSCAKTCGSTNVFDFIPQGLRMENDDFVSFKTSNNDPVTCWFSYYVKDKDYRFGKGETIESCQVECMDDNKCVGIEFIPNRSTGNCALWLEGACFSEDSQGRFACPNASVKTYVRYEAICKQALPCLTTVDASDLEMQDDVCEDRECWDNKFHYKHCKVMDDCKDSYCRNLNASPFRVCVDKVSGTPIEFSIELPTESPTPDSPTETPVPREKKSKTKKHPENSKGPKDKKAKSTK